MPERTFLAESEGRKCDGCKKQATTNIQKVWVKWKYNAKKGNYSDLEFLNIPTLEGENLHLCDSCAELWDQGEI